MPICTTKQAFATLARYELLNQMPQLVFVSVLLASLALVGSCKREPERQFADWLLPVPVDAAVREYDGIDPSERANGSVRLVEDLVLGGEELFVPRGIAAAPSGTIFVSDISSNNVKVFDPDGGFWGTLGREGQGPGEFAGIGDLTIAGELLVVHDERGRRLSAWSLSGVHISDHALPAGHFLHALKGLSDGTLIVQTTGLSSTTRTRSTRIGRITLEGELLATFHETTAPVPQPDAPRDVARIQRALDSSAENRMVLAVGTGEIVYLSNASAYQVKAMNDDAQTQWALRVTWPRAQWPDGAKERMLATLASTFGFDEAPRLDDLVWPDYRTLLGIATDGIGRLYVFPLAPHESETAGSPATYFVDVYSTDGEFIAADTISNLWSAAQGEFVYGFRVDNSGETEVVRYRLEVSR